MKKIIVFLSFFLPSIGISAQNIITDTIMSIHEHSGDVNQAIYSLDGRRVVSCGMDRKVNIYEAINWYSYGSYSHMDQVTHVAISRDNGIVASISKDNVIKVYSLDTAKIMFECVGNEGVPTGLAIDMGMRFLYSSSNDGFIRIYDLKKEGKLSRKFSAGMAVTSLALSHKGFIFAGLRSGEVKVYNYLGKEVKTFTAHTGEVTHMYYGFKGNVSYLLTGSEDQTVKLFNAANYQEVRTFTGHTWKVNHVEISRDLKYVLSASNDGTAKIWDLETGAILQSLEKMGDVVKCISINGDNTNVITSALVRTGEPEYAIYIWDPLLVIKEVPMKKEDEVEKIPVKMQTK